MPNTMSAEKRVRQSARRRARNLWRKRRVKNQIKSFLDAVASHDGAKAQEEYRKTCGLLDRVACTGTIHQNTAARRKSRLARHLHAMSPGSKA